MCAVLLKAANILVAGDGRVALGDLGTCAVLEPRSARVGASAPHLHRYSLDAAQAYLGQDKFKGTAQYHAPGVRSRSLLPFGSFAPAHRKLQPAGNRFVDHAFNRPAEGYSGHPVVHTLTDDRLSRAPC